MTKIIGLVQGKGGAGLSTVSTNLSGELSKVCKTVLIGLVMPQGTSASEMLLREENCPFEPQSFRINVETSTEIIDTLDEY